MTRVHVDTHADFSKHLLISIFNYLYFHSPKEIKEKLSLNQMTNLN